MYFLWNFWQALPALVVPYLLRTNLRPGALDILFSTKAACLRSCHLLSSTAAAAAPNG